MNEARQAALRRYVVLGARLPTGHCIPGNEMMAGPSPETLFASLLVRDDVKLGYTDAVMRAQPAADWQEGEVYALHEHAMAPDSAGYVYAWRSRRADNLERPALEAEAWEISDMPPQRSLVAPGWDLGATYGRSALASQGGHTWISNAASNVGNEPAAGSPWWSQARTAQFLRTVREASLSIQFYRRGAKDAARRFLDWIESPHGQIAEERMGLERPVGPSDGWGPRIFPRMAIQPVWRYRNLDAIIADGWEERAGIDLVIHYGHSAAQDTGCAETVRVSVRGAGAPLSGIERTITNG